ncbi:MAG TPA: RNA polymerase sigma factor RpoD/SigA [Verrucomicrobiae bacterium]|nr:RNA polymerase sigma factor RpoD/SigA [Verrucomicrobiae bacterium]
MIRPAEQISAAPARRSVAKPRHNPSFARSRPKNAKNGLFYLARIEREEKPAASPAPANSTDVRQREVIVSPPREAYDGNSALTLYLREVGQVKLLTPQEEIELAGKIKKGSAKAREHMIKANLRLVVKMAREYDGLGLPLLDLISEGNIGLMSAVERFDPQKGAKLATYSSWWIRQSMRRALANQAKTIRLPVHMVDKIYHLRKAELRLQETFGREPTDAEVASELGLTARQVSSMRVSSLRPASLDAPLGEDGSTHLGEIVADENAATPYEQLEGRATIEMLRQMVEALDPREATVLRFRFGLDGGQERTLDEVGKQFGLTRERIRQLQNMALKKLRRLIERRQMIKKAA